MSEAFHIMEYKSLKEEVLLRMRQVDDSFRFMMIAVAASMTWTLSNYKTFNDGLYIMLFFVPLFISAGFTLYIVALNKSVLWRAVYIRQLEQRFGDDGLGWESSPQHARFARKLTGYGTARGLMVAINLIAVMFAGYMLVENTNLVSHIQVLMAGAAV